jgi:hypothetical protein
MICASRIELLSKQNDNTLFPATALRMFGREQFFLLELYAQMV